MRTIATSPQAIADELAPLFAAEKAAFARRCRERQISMAHLFVMVMIEREGPIPMTRVAELIGSGLPTATGLVGRMEDRGLVRRTHDDRDRRVVLVALTNSGAAELSSLHAARHARIAAVAADLSEGERAQLLSAIRVLRAAYERADRKGAAS
jgi:MarR family transcriptional regulator, organic hydroperoxide resistance regulator